MTDRALTLRRRFLLLRALRWFPTGVLIPVFVLFVLDRGFTLAQYGTAAAAQAVVILLLELPTGGLADVAGNRRVLIVASITDLVSLSLLLIADSMPLLVAVFAVQGLFRALESGPLEAWYVSAALERDPEVDIEGDLAAGGTVLGLAIAAGSLASSGLVATAGPLGVEPPLLLPVAVAVALRLVDVVAVAVLMTEADGESVTSLQSPLGPLLSGVPSMIGEAVRLIVASPVLIALLAVELLWGIGLVGFETLFPPRLSEVLDDPARAATLLGPAGTAAWLLSAAGSAAVPKLSRRIGPAMAGATLRIVQGATVAALAVVAGPVGLIIAYLATLTVHGASNVVHGGLLHANTASSHRATVLSANSMAAHLGGGVGGVVLGLLATSAGLTPAISVAAATLALAAPLYLVGRR